MSEPSEISPRLTHVDSATGEVAMVDVGGKELSAREAVAEGFIILAPDTLRLVRENRLRKGDVLAAARIAGIQAAKLTERLIPLCHQIPLTKAGVEFAMEDDGIRISCTARTVARTGVEMEALTGVSIAALTIYDMCKAVDNEMRITDVRLVSKSKQSSSDS